MAKSPDAFRTISEVAEWLDTPAHVLRFWESKFTQVKPVKRAGGRRYYRPDDMALLGGIKTLLHDDGLTIKGAQKLLREKGVRHVMALAPVVPGREALDRIAGGEPLVIDEVAMPVDHEALPGPASDLEAASGGERRHDPGAAGEGAPEEPPPEDAVLPSLAEGAQRVEAGLEEVELPASEPAPLQGSGSESSLGGPAGVDSTGGDDGEPDAAPDLREDALDHGAGLEDVDLPTPEHTPLDGTGEDDPITAEASGLEEADLPPTAIPATDEDSPLAATASDDGGAGWTPPSDEEAAASGDGSVRVAGLEEMDLLQTAIPGTDEDPTLTATASDDGGAGWTAAASDEEVAASEDGSDRVADLEEVDLAPADGPDASTDGLEAEGAGADDLTPGGTGPEPAEAPFEEAEAPAEAATILSFPRPAPTGGDDSVDDPTPAAAILGALAAPSRRPAVSLLGPLLAASPDRLRARRSDLVPLVARLAALAESRPRP